MVDSFCPYIQTTILPTLVLMMTVILKENAHSF